MNKLKWLLLVNYILYCAFDLMLIKYYGIKIFWFFFPILIVLAWFVGKLDAKDEKEVNKNG